MDWVYIMDGMSRTDEALAYLDEQPLRIAIWVEERRSQGKLYHGKKALQIDKKTTYAYEGEIDGNNELACGYGVATRADGATYTGMVYLDKFHGIGTHKFHG